MIIALSGKQGSGKDTVSKLIQEHSPIFWEEKKFAGALKKICSIILGVPISCFEVESLKKTELPQQWDRDGRPITLREAMQIIGTDCLRDHFNKDVWINSLFADYITTSYWIISDLRFRNEYRAIKDKGGIVIRIERPGAKHDAHLSETELDNSEWDYVIYNDGTLAELEFKVKEILAKIFHEKN